MMQSSDSYLGEQFLRSEQEQEQEQEHGENQTVKTKKAPLREGPNCFKNHACICRDFRLFTLNYLG